MADYTLNKTGPSIDALLDIVDGNLPTVNRFKGDQNFNVEGNTGDTLPGATPTTYTVGTQVTASRTVVAANLVNATYADGGSGVIVFNADSGSYYQEYDGDFTNDYFALVLADGTHYTDPTGISAALIGGKTRITVDMSVAPAHKFIGFSQSIGQYPDVSDDESLSETYIPVSIGKIPLDVTGSRVSGVTYTNEDPFQPLQLGISIGGNSNATLNVDGEDVLLAASSVNARGLMTWTVRPLGEYTLTYSSLVKFVEG